MNNFITIYYLHYKIQYAKKSPFEVKKIKHSVTG